MSFVTYLGVVTKNITENCAYCKLPPTVNCRRNKKQQQMNTVMNHQNYES